MKVPNYLIWVIIYSLIAWISEMATELFEFVNCEASSSKLRGSISFILIHFLWFCCHLHNRVSQYTVLFPLPLKFCPSCFVLNLIRYLFSLDFYLTDWSAIFLYAYRFKLWFILILNKFILPRKFRIYSSFMVPLLFYGLLILIQK